VAARGRAVDGADGMQRRRARKSAEARVVPTKAGIQP